MSAAHRPKTKSKRTLDLTPGGGEMIKPGELIDVSGASKLTLADRRLYNLLIRNAFGPQLGKEGARFEIPIADLRDTHESNDRLVASIEALMTTVVTIHRADGSTDRVQLLGWNNLADRRRRRGTLRYAIAPELAALLRDSVVFAKLEMEVLRAFSSKYAISLYEAIARRVRQAYVLSEVVDLEVFRECILGVPPGKLTTFGNLNRFAIKPAVQEVNALADFHVTITPQKRGRRVSAVWLHWHEKDVEGRRLAYAELRRSCGDRRTQAEELPLGN